MKKNIAGVVSEIALTVAAVVLLSILSVRLQGQKEEQVSTIRPVVYDTMAVSEFIEVNRVPAKLVKEMFGLKSKSDLNKKFNQIGLTSSDVESIYIKANTLSQEYESRNWVKIPLKFILTIVVLLFVFNFLKKKQINHTRRKLFLSSAVLIFGVVLGSDPNPMGTVKDAIVLLGTKHMIFPPRLVAFIVFLSMVVLANKFICSWACQFGTLQDLIFRISHGKNKKSELPTLKVPFKISNAVRILFFIVVVVSAFYFSFDITAQIDPFKIFNPLKIGAIGGIFLFCMILLSTVIYRPWCHFFCPFGLVGWIAERFSRYRIGVNRTTCIKCNKCKDSCPSTVMGAILEENRTIPDCFSCGVCIEVCPTDSVFLGKVRGGK